MAGNTVKHICFPVRCLLSPFPCQRKLLVNRRQGGAGDGGHEPPWQGPCRLKLGQLRVVIHRPKHPGFLDIGLSGDLDPTRRRLYCFLIVQGT
jgi:hypothetical protein